MEPFGVGSLGLNRNASFLQWGGLANPKPFRHKKQRFSSEA
jgi:hypothetical protein